jgi:hypothetical protein
VLSGNYATDQQRNERESTNASKPHCDPATPLALDHAVHRNLRNCVTTARAALLAAPICFPRYKK